ncbi:hypothetical protein AURDEDRAFT_130109 [Auricularia subglabra TFB-10046 SS5]|uniref:Replication factor A C-terminal domain-containing protein n=1 Tax=Auricularia subglabra (strain TFB-10046 / SS5) TaxID=717982 RepID=J0WU85_AURST|nr:hypothetical protein AURDEDRAFT_130109 [Auricularia subglabra TFB-10046 SS5]
MRLKHDHPALAMQVHHGTLSTKATVPEVTAELGVPYGTFKNWRRISSQVRVLLGLLQPLNDLDATVVAVSSVSLRSLGTAPPRLVVDLADGTHMLNAVLLGTARQLCQTAAFGETSLVCVTLMERRLGLWHGAALLHSLGYTPFQAHLIASALLEASTTAEQVAHVARGLTIPILYTGPPDEHASIARLFLVAWISDESSVLAARKVDDIPDPVLRVDGSIVFAGTVTLIAYKEEAVMWYPICAECRDCLEHDEDICPGCDYNGPMRWCYHIEYVIEDPSGRAVIRLFDDTAPKVIGMPANDLRHLALFMRRDFDIVMQGSLGRDWSVRVMACTEARLAPLQLPQRRIRCTVPGCKTKCHWEIYEGPDEALKDATVAECSYHGMVVLRLAAARATSRYRVLPFALTDRQRRAESHSTVGGSHLRCGLKRHDDAKGDGLVSTAVLERPLRDLD